METRIRSTSAKSLYKRPSGSFPRHGLAGESAGCNYLQSPVIHLAGAPFYMARSAGFGHLIDLRRQQASNGVGGGVLFSRREWEHPSWSGGGMHLGRAAKAAASQRVAPSPLAYSNKGGSHAIHGYLQKCPSRSGGHSPFSTLSSCRTSRSFSCRIWTTRCGPPPEGSVTSMHVQVAGCFSRAPAALDPSLRFVRQESQFGPVVRPSSG